MIVLYILLGIVALFALACFLRVNLNIVYEDELLVFLRILFVKIRLYPERKKKYKHKKKKKSEPTHVVRQAGEPKPLNLVDHLKIIGEVISTFINHFSSHLTLKLAKIYIKVATPDAAQTAILYGVVGGAVDCIVNMLDEITNIKRVKVRSVLVEPDFLSESCEAKINISLSVSSFGAVITLAKTLWTYTKLKNQNSK